jgi:uncharacterized protein (TIGR02145 family)
MNNGSGFSALPGGFRSNDGTFGFQGFGGLWWSATEYGASGAWYRGLAYSDGGLFRNSSNESGGFSVRLVKD